MTSTSGLPATSKKPALKKLSHRHQRVLDIMLRNPEMRLQEIADELGYTVPWISTIVNSDLFQEALKKRREAFERHDNRVITEKLNNITHKGLDLLMDHIDYDPDYEEGEDLLDDGPSFQEIKQVTELAMKASGYLGNKGPNVTVNNNNNNVVAAPQVAQSTMEEARARLIGHGSAGAKQSNPKALPAS